MANGFVVLVSSSAERWIDDLSFPFWVAWIEIREGLKDDASRDLLDVEEVGPNAYVIQHSGVLVVYEFVQGTTVRILHVLRSFAIG